MASATLSKPVGLVSGFHALSDPTRIEIIALLQDGERCVCELMDVLDSAQSRLSFHLRVLKEAGLVTDRRDGRWVYYTLNTDAIHELELFLTNLQRTPTTRTHPRVSACCV
jgi:ArsR family transcriptional regulator